MFDALGRAAVVIERALDGTVRANVPHLVRHSPTGFEAGYGGSGPADLAFSILAATRGVEFAEANYQQFKWDVIAKLQIEPGARVFLPVESLPR